MMESVTMSIRLSPQTRERLDKLAQATDRSKSWLAAQAVEAFLDLQEWQVAAIQEGLAQAERGEFVEQDTVLAKLRQWDR